MNKRILVAIAWPYVNGDLHLGHLSGYLLPADIFARYKRLRGDDVLMVSGSDCHGTPITVEADKLGLSPAEVVEIYHKKDVELFRKYGLSYNLYTKTNTSVHKRVVQDIFIDLLKNGFLVKESAKQYYSEQDKKFLPDRYVEGTCPYCNATEQRSDQCEKCGRWLSDGELLEPYSKQTKAPVILKETEHYFLDFPKLNQSLREYVDSKQNVWRNWVWSEADGWLREGLQKRAITRDLDWGIELPIDRIEKLSADKRLSDYSGKKIYVWFEAVVGYLSAPQEWAEYDQEPNNYAGIYSRYTKQSRDWKDWWINSEAEQYYFMGQDNLVFHTLMWPGQLMGAQKNYQLPHNVIVNRFMNYEGKKFSKSRNWTIDSVKIAEKYGVDSVRYAIASNFPENKEADFTWMGFVEAINNELVANFGNFVNRSLKFFESRFSGKIKIDDFVLQDEITKQIKNTYELVAEKIDNAQFTEALNQIMALSKFANQYFDQQKIWQIIKEDEQSAKRIMLNLLNIIYNLSLLISPYLPQTSQKICDYFGKIKENEATVGEDKWRISTHSEFQLTKEVTILFDKLDLEIVLNEKV